MDSKRRAFSTGDVDKAIEERKRYGLKRYLSVTTQQSSQENYRRICATYAATIIQSRWPTRSPLRVLHMRRSAQEAITSIEVHKRAHNNSDSGTTEVKRVR